MNLIFKDQETSQRQNDPLTERIINVAIEVHQVPVPIVYRDVKLDSGYRIDMIVEDEVIVEIKSVANLLPVHHAQLLSYLKHNGGGRGLLINFNVKLLKDGIKRLIV
jgi:GxxExxY protein